MEQTTTHFTDLDTWLHMGGYAAYVWPVYGLAAVTMLGLIGWCYVERRRARRSLEAIESESRSV